MQRTTRLSYSPRRILKKEEFDETLASSMVTTITFCLKKKVNEYYLLEVEGFSEISFWIINLSWMFYLHFLYISLSEFKIIFVIIYFFFIEKNINKNFGEDKHKISDYSN